MDQFTGNDSQGFRDLHQETDGVMGRRAIIKRFSATSGGNLAQGVAPTKSFILIETACQLKYMTFRDVAVQAGLYAVGDVQLKTRLPIFGADNKTKQNVDGMILDGVPFQQVGLPFPVPGGGGVMEYQSTWRKQ